MFIVSPYHNSEHTHKDAHLWRWFLAHLCSNIKQKLQWVQSTNWFLHNGSKYPKPFRQRDDSICNMQILWMLNNFIAAIFICVAKTLLNLSEKTNMPARYLLLFAHKNIAMQIRTEKSGRLIIIIFFNCVRVFVLIKTCSVRMLPKFKAASHFLSFPEW